MQREQKVRAYKLTYNPDTNTYSLVIPSTGVIRTVPGLDFNTMWVASVTDDPSWLSETKNDIQRTIIFAARKDKMKERESNGTNNTVLDVCTYLHKLIQANDLRCNFCWKPITELGNAIVLQKPSGTIVLHKGECDQNTRNEKHWDELSCFVVHTKDGLAVEYKQSDPLGIPTGNVFTFNPDTLELTLKEKKVPK